MRGPWNFLWRRGTHGIVLAIMKVPFVFCESSSSTFQSIKNRIISKNAAVNTFTPGRAIWPNDRHRKKKFSRGLSTKYCKCSDGSFL